MRGHIILTLLLTKDPSTFNYNNYLRILRQEGVKQDIYVISAEPVQVKDNIVIKIPQHLPVPIRIGMTVNIALKNFDLSKYSHIFKVDGDVGLPLDYCKNLLEKCVPVAGRGAALLISTEFFINVMKGKYPACYCDDGYVSALSTALGHWPPEYDGKGKVVIPVIRQPLREFSYGYEYYKWGLPLSLLLLFSLILLLSNRKDFISVVNNIAGYISAFLRGERRYGWWRSYRYFRVRHAVTKFLQKLTKVL